MGVRWDRARERQSFVGFVLTVIAVVVPVVVLVVCGFGSLWCDVLGVKPHHIFWAWLSHDYKDKNGQQVSAVGNVPVWWFFGIFNAYVLYQFGELLYACYRALHRAMNPRTHVW